MSVGSDLRNEFTSYLDQSGFRYMVVSENDNIVLLGFSGRGGFDTRIYVDFDESVDAHGIACVHFVAQDFAKCADENVAAVIVKLNEFNRRFRWTKFWLDQSDNTISADGDAMIFSGSTGRECLDYVIHVSEIVQLAYEDLGDLIIKDADGSDEPDPAELLAMLEALRSMIGDVDQ